jgi:hypothetical protein
MLIFLFDFVFSMPDFVFLCLILFFSMPDFVFSMPDFVFLLLVHAVTHSHREVEYRFMFTYTHKNID